MSAILPLPASDREHDNGISGCVWSRWRDIRHMPESRAVVESLLVVSCSFHQVIRVAYPRGSPINLCHSSVCALDSPPCRRSSIKLASWDEPVRMVADTISPQPNIGKHILKRHGASELVPAKEYMEPSLSWQPEITPLQDSFLASIPTPRTDMTVFSVRFRNVG